MGIKQIKSPEKKFEKCYFIINNIPFTPPNHSLVAQSYVFSLVKLLGITKGGDPEVTRIGSKMKIS